MWLKESLAMVEYAIKHKLRKHDKALRDYRKRLLIELQKKNEPRPNKTNQRRE